MLTEGQRDGVDTATTSTTTESRPEGRLSLDRHELFLVAVVEDGSDGFVSLRWR
jgi:hypothetical protein